MNLRKLVFLSFVAVLTTMALQSQPKEGEAIDKVIAVVGNDIVMQSELNGQLQALAQQDKSMNPDDPAVIAKVLDLLINEKLVVIKAMEDSITATDEEIKQQWEQQLSKYVEIYGSIKRIEDIYGMSIDRIQYDLRDEIRKHILSMKIKQMRFSDIKVTQREVQEFYTTYKDSLPNVPEQVEIYHIVKFIEPKQTAKKEIFELAIRVRDSLLKGGDFGAFAARYSGDPGTATAGGELGWIAKGRLFAEYEKAALDQEKNQISVPIETPFGFHLIQTIDKNKDSLLTRHILFKFGQSEDDRKTVIDTLNSIRARVEKGASFEDLAKQYTDEEETKGFGGFIGKFPISNVPASLKEVLGALKEGGISDPLPYGADPKPSFHIVYKKKLIPEHKATIADDYKQLEMLAQSFKQNKVYLEWVEDLRKTIYWEIKKN